jgi:transposase
MNQEQLFTQALGLTSPWVVDDIDFDPKAQRIDFQFAAYVHAQVPRVRCGGCKKSTQVEVPWARPGSRFTLLFEAFTLTLAKAMPVLATARQPKTDDRALWRFSEALADHQGQSDQIRQASIDMPKAYISSLGQHLPKAEVRHDARLKRTKWAWLKDMARWSKKQDEAMNSLVQAAKARARGYGTANHFIAIRFLIAGKLKHLPEKPFQPPLSQMVAS